MRVALGKVLSIGSFAICACAARTTPQPGGDAVPAWMQGTWTRESVDAKDAGSWKPKHVHYVQTPTRFGDVRVPHARPALTARSFAELTDADLAALATQSGFAGVTTFAGDVATWTHWIDFQPPSDDMDRGRVERVGAGRNDEHSLDGSATEHWVALSDGDDRFLAVEVRRNKRLVRMLVVAGDHFVYARNRARDLPAADSITDLIAKTNADRDTIIGYLDCELSYGLVRGADREWEIRASTLPWREGVQLEMPRELEVRNDRLLPIRPDDGEVWTVTADTFAPIDLRALLRTDGGR